MLARDEIHRHAAARRAPHREADARRRLAAGASSLNADGNTGRGRSSGQQKKLQGHSPALIRARGELAELAADGSRRDVIRFRNGVSSCEAERRPVEIVVRDEPRMLAAAAARELDAVDGRMVAARQLARGGGSATACTCVSPCSGHEKV